MQELFGKLVKGLVTLMVDHCQVEVRWQTCEENYQVHLKGLSETPFCHSL
jgi:hypothetical protein